LAAHGKASDREATGLIRFGHGLGPCSAGIGRGERRGGDARLGRVSRRVVSTAE
jgi:hypothetical protein